MKTCKNCKIDFQITQDDISFYDRIPPVINGKKFPIPEPTLCPTCRWQRRLAFRNESTLYKSKCALTGRPMISMHQADSKFPVYFITEWLSDKWDPLDYGRDFDFKRPFFEQFKELCDSIPHFNAFIDPHMDVNSEYTNCSSEAKNCYMITQAERNEDCYYSRGINGCKDCCDCLRVYKCELCYEGINLNNCYKCLYSQDCDNCSDCHFSTDLKGCQNCLGCHGLKQKQYHVFNKPVSKEQWEKQIVNSQWDVDFIEKTKRFSEDLRIKIPKQATRNLQCENVTGEDVLQCKNSKNVFDSKQLEECAYCYEVSTNVKYCHDFSMWGINCELLYECNGCGYNVYNTIFCNHCWNTISNLMYCESCFPSVKNCFGCFGLHRNEYCILNKKYSREEYEKLVPKIIEHMQKTKEWGEFFPMRISAYRYEESLANEFFPVDNKPTWTTSDSISDDVLKCEITGSVYKIIPQELKLYQKLGVPIPKRCPRQRHKERMAKRTPRNLWARKCNKCNADILTSYPPEKPEIIYCEDCYQKTVY